MKLGILILISFCNGISTQESESEKQFSPSVTAVCRGNQMIISVNTFNPFYGLVISRNNRNNTSCYIEGNGKNLTNLILNMAASFKDTDYCGVSINHKTSEKTVQIGVRQHKTLELAEDKLYIVACGKYNSPPPSSYTPARLYFTDSTSREVKEVVKSHAYKLRIKTNGDSDFRIRSCFSFTNSGDNNQVQLFDAMGCPESRIMSNWNYYNKNEAESTIFSMFRFQESKDITFQCHVLFCDTDACPATTCQNVTENSAKFYNPQPLTQDQNQTYNVLASVTVTVLSPGDKISPYVSDSTLSDYCSSNSKYCPYWLLWLAIILGVLFILMLLVNLFLCTALTCTCTRTELIEKDPSILEDYDPYRSSWAGSQYANSRYSINEPKKYTESNLSDHYAIPNQFNSRPGSRFDKV